MSGFCQVRSGFFILRDCSREAVAVCSSCGKMVCKKCSTKQGVGKVLCTECGNVQDSPAEDDVHGRGWSRRYRNRYYGHRGHRPYYLGGGHRHHHADTHDVNSDVETAAFEQNDFESFENGGDAGPEFDEDTSADFMDS